MANISIKLNVQQLKHVVREFTGKDGKKIKCLLIPIEENMLFEGEKGTYLNLTAIEIKNKVGDSKDTHLIKQDIPKDQYEAMSEDERKSFPILGNAIYWGGFKEKDPVASSDLSNSAIDAYMDEKGEPDDLPF